MLTHSFLHAPERPTPLLGSGGLLEWGATIHLTGDTLENGILLEKGHKMIKLAAEDKPPWTEQADLPSKSGSLDPGMGGMSCVLG